MTRIEEIYEFVLPEMAANGIEDTIDNRISFLEGLRDGWKEDPEPATTDEVFEKTFYMMAISAEIFGLQMKSMYSIKTEGERNPS